jgi:hypothetical protein
MKHLIKYCAILISGLVISGCSLQPANSGVRVETTPVSTVYLDGQQVGVTPYENKKIKPGEISLRLVPQSPPGSTFVSWEGKIRMTPGIQTLVFRNFAESLAASSGNILTFERVGGKTAALSVVSVPDAATVKVDGQYQGFTPVSLQVVTEGDHQILLAAPGFQDQLVSARALSGYRLVVSAQLAQLSATTNPTPSQTPTPAPSGTPSASVKPSPVLSATTTPVPNSSAKPVASAPPKPYVTIQSTPTGWLRVRSDATTDASEVGRDNPGEMYPYRTKSSDGSWYQIEYQSGKFGWVSSQYALKTD